MKITTLRAVPALLLLAFSGGAAAAAFQLLEQNASGLGNAYAGSAAVADNASTVFFNPAGMTQLPGRQLSVGVAGIGTRFAFRDAGSTAGGGNGGNAGGWAAVPNAYFSSQLTPKLFVGFGVSAPFGLSTEYEDAGWAGRFQSLKSEIRTVNYNPSLAYRLSDKVSLGLGLNYQTLDAEMGNLTPLGRYRVKGDDSTWGWNAGALFTLSPAMRVGVSYRSAMDYTLEGSRTLAGVSRPATADIKLPDTVILSVWQQLSEHWEAMGDLSYTNWSTLDKLTIRYAGGSDVETFGYKDSWRLAWGAAYKANEAVKLKFGLAYDRTPTTGSDRSARLPDNDRLWLSVGGQWNGGPLGRVDLGYSYLYVKDPGINQSKLGTALRGEYDVSAHLVGVQYSLGF